MIYLFENQDNIASVIYQEWTLTDEHKKKGIPLDNLPVAVEIEGKIPVLKCSFETKEVWYDYIDAHVIEDEDQLPIDETLEAKVVRLEENVKNLEDKNLELEAQLFQAQSDNLTTLEACAELYELLLASQPI